MRRLSAERDWVRQASALTVEPNGVWPADERTTAEELVTRLVQHARVLVGLGGCQGETHRECLLAGTPHGVTACALAPVLARVPRPSDARFAHVDDPATAYLQALRDAGSAVSFCRRVEHRSDRCFFSTDGRAGEVCGRVLALAHRL